MATSDERSKNGMGYYVVDAAAQEVKSVVCNLMKLCNIYGFSVMFVCHESAG